MPAVTRSLKSLAQKAFGAGHLEITRAGNVPRFDLLFRNLKRYGLEPKAVFDIGVDTGTPEEKKHGKGGYIGIGAGAAFEGSELRSQKDPFSVPDMVSVETSAMPSITRYELAVGISTIPEGVPS